MTALPPLLDAAVNRLESSSWPEVASTWSRLTPTGFPVELATASQSTGPRGSGGLRWTAEVAGPELPEAHRLPRAAALLAASGQAPRPDLVARLVAAQSSTALRFGAWLGGRETTGRTPGLKLYAELPSLAAAPLPGHIEAAWYRLPTGTRPRMLGVEPARGRYELYARLPSVDAFDLLTFLYAAGHPAALAVLDAGLPDGLRRLSGRRLGLSMAWTADSPITLTLFVSARTLFPMAPDALAELAPALKRVRRLDVRSALVAIGLDPARDELSVSVGLVPAGPGRPLGSKSGRPATSTTSARPSHGPNHSPSTLG
ncbi:hypothetical protein [Streptomyces rhizosphaerihabitans]|uniref:hypothetical protein n=1 Tax=Streptomyces rhizosphaerihabitans TaxID=1266770 RepID=UPI0021BFE703|nr:hypothetical protein [Streptomyces rhizosphaerihabitans]MCT9010791.1 hypothetical protein [Streptomyces rhizosphaerihabitans]